MEKLRQSPIRLGHIELTTVRDDGHRFIGSTARRELGGRIRLGSLKDPLHHIEVARIDVTRSRRDGDEAQFQVRVIGQEQTMKQVVHRGEGRTVCAQSEHLIGTPHVNAHLESHVPNVPGDSFGADRVSSVRGQVGVGQHGNRGST